jgi:hypothetical protein
MKAELPVLVDQGERFRPPHYDRKHTQSSSFCCDGFLEKVLESETEKHGYAFWLSSA